MYFSFTSKLNLRDAWDELMGISRIVSPAIQDESSLPTHAVNEQVAPTPLILLDWDDTLLPNTHLAKLGFTSEDQAFQVPNDCVSVLAELANEVETFLTACLKLGTCYIVTNGLQGWVERSCERFLPNIVPLLKRMTIISARSSFENVFPDRPIEWKIAVYHDILAKRGLMQMARIQTHSGYVQQQECELQQVIALGDSHVDRCAIQYVAQRTPKIQLKSIKLLDNPSMTQLRKQVHLLGTFLEQLSTHDETLDLELSNDMLK
ncbi:hypothetical protein PsorP6_014300 [Peronosclerospora sorghi]|uniref:Uncharacterized protein n=1 Tax=Peronosclerospora sorghi TaxID=230839 RepID=A0ACC0VIW7_9STRA|nr:hypothetical protein PsorP6_014300 [Peronosclerospora sorghi]